mgnify:CR=1 FL=1
MAYNILGVNSFHNGSVCVLSDGEIVYYLEEERLTKFKYDANPFRTILDTLDKFTIDEVVIGGINLNDAELSYTWEDPFFALIRKFYSKIKYSKISNYHHYTHIKYTYPNSGFNNALGIIIDGGGSEFSDKGIEQNSVYKCSPKKIQNINKDYLKHNSLTPQSINVGPLYSAISSYLGFKLNEEGKTMGLSSYGKFNSSIPSFFKGHKSDADMVSEISTTDFIRQYKYGTFFTQVHPSNSLEYSQEEKDIAYKVQQESQQIVGDYIEEYIRKTGLKNVCCAGGYFLNCVANYYLTKRFPDVNFYFEPISHDGGTSIGVAYWRWKELNPTFQFKKLKSLYLGPQYSKEELLKGIQKYI